MKFFKHIAFAAFISTTIGVSSCKDFLDVSDDLAAELTMEEVFNNVNQTKRFHRYIYSAIPDMSNIILNGSYAGLNGLDNPWPSLSDELKAAQNNTKDIPSKGYSAANADFSRWHLYQQIRQANLFMQNVHPILTGEETGNVIEEKEVETLKNEARFLRAYYHYLLFELYGAIPIMDKVADPSASDLDFYREPIDNVADFIVNEMTACLSLLPDKEESNDRAAAPTKAAAYAVIAKTRMYQASPLFNGGYQEAMSLRDDRNIPLFPAENRDKWKVATKALEDLFVYLESQNRNKLFTCDKNGENIGIDVADSSFDAAASLYYIDFKFSANCNPEVLWYSSKESWGGIGGEGRERRCTPRSVYQGFCCVGVLQEMVDDYFMKDGKTIETSDLYNKSTEYVLGEDGIANMYKNREPRFYRDVTFSGRLWQNTTDKYIHFYKGSGNDNSAGDNPYTGYLLYKGMCHDILNTGNFKRNQYRPCPLFRLADFYLLYAEALNEVNPSDSRILEYINKVRSRAGIPNVEKCVKDIKGNKEKQFEAIRHERRVELFAEGQRYFDVRRWMLADKDGDCLQNGDFTGMNMGANNHKDFMQRTVFETRIFEKRMYLYPLPLNEVQKSKKLVQNPGW